MENPKSPDQRLNRRIAGMAALIGVLCLFAAGCSSTSTSIESGSPAEGEGSASSREPTDDDANGEDGNDSSDLINPDPGGDDLVVCAGTQFPLSALRALEPMSSRPEVEAAVNVFLESGEGDFWPQDGWQIVSISDSEVYVIVLQTEAQVLKSVEEREVEVFFDDGFADGVDDTIMFSGHNVELVDGAWRWSGSVGGEDCELESVVPEGLNRVEWELDPDFPAPTADSTSVSLLATERNCVGGQPMGERFLPPTIVETDTAVLVAMVATPPSGDAFTCPGNPSQAVTIELSAPIGDRELRDGSKTAGRLSDYVGDVFGLPSSDD